jgi:hypothetical protein
MAIRTQIVANRKDTSVAVRRLTARPRAAQGATALRR